MNGVQQVEADRGTPGEFGLRVGAGAPSALQRRLMELEHLDASGLRQEWRRLFRSDPPQLSRDLVLRALAYRLQEREHGGLSKATLRRIGAQAKELRADDSDQAEPRASLRPGARLVREWRGRTHTVTVTEEGFEYGGMSYASLTPIAQAITGAHWSGPRFFGLVRQHTSKAVTPTPARTEVRHG